ncbi:MAG: hypothetical protein BV457_00100 [Thermoplasmata archaeon M9B1D]|nr:MAG: hypothetical protein BV457_00100 [Thermoplasmata archaeon M9B1D]PNX52234.1 MAG: hypothetical protein BV456_00195 [Thermoplasmata archaeon M8B2D]
MLKKLLKLLNNLIFFQISSKNEVLSHNIKYFERLEGVDLKLVNILKKVSLNYPIAIMANGGKRDLKTQRMLFNAGKTKTMNSKHLTGNAADVSPVINGRININSELDLAYMCGYIKAVADMECVQLTQGCKWKRKSIADNKKNGFLDMYHQELI